MTNLELALMIIAIIEYVIIGIITVVYFIKKSSSSRVPVLVIVGFIILWPILGLVALDYER